jgi:hypothetical protein
MILTEKLDYSGDLIHSPFAYKFYRKNLPPLGAIIAFRGKMDVKEHLIDLEDALDDDFIYSEDALNFCWEIPNMNPIGAVAFQRLFSNLVANFLRDSDVNIRVFGDDIKTLNKDKLSTSYKKLSVSITKCENGVAYGHLGLNNNAGPKAPHFAGSLELSDSSAKFLMEQICAMFYDTLADINLAARKVI